VDFRSNTDALEKAPNSFSYYKSKHYSPIALPLPNFTTDIIKMKPTSGMNLLPTNCSPSWYCGKDIDSVVNLKPNIYFAKGNNGKYRRKNNVPLSAQTAMQDSMKAKL
jgi:hypothetical protein